MNAGKLRDLEAEDMRRIRDERLASRKRAARPVIEDGGCWAHAAEASQSTPNTVKRWAEEGGWKVSS